MRVTIKEAKNRLDRVINKSRVHLYKPKQIAEILYRHRTKGDIVLSNLESYRKESKHWRDEMSLALLGRVCTSSAKFQDNLQLNSQKMVHSENAMAYRVGITNAADIDIDMYSNWGPTIQVKHLSLDVDLAQNIVSNISSNNIINVCKDAEKKVISSLLSPIGWKSRIQSIVTEKDLILWYEKALRGKYAPWLAKKLMNTLSEEICNGFPSINQLPTKPTRRHYEKISSAF